MNILGEHVTRASLAEDAKRTRKYLAEAFENAGFTDKDRFESDKLRILTNRRDRSWVYCYKNLVLLRKSLVKGALGYEVQYEMPVGERTEEKEVRRFEERKFSPSDDPFNPTESVG